MERAIHEPTSGPLADGGGSTRLGPEASGGPAWEALAGLPGFRAVGEDQWSARCPAHDDRQASLSIKQTDDRILLHCHAGCATEAVVEALDLTMAALFTARPEQDPHPRSARLREHVYTDADGKPLYRIVRHDRKVNKYTTEHVAADGSWRPGRGGHPPMLYRLPELLALPRSEDIWCTEGERDADTSWNLGIPAATVPSNSWGRVDLELFRGRPVWVICDADDAGISHGRKRAEALRNAGAHLEEDVIVFPVVPGIARPDLTDLVEWAQRQLGPEDPRVPMRVMENLRPIEAWGGRRSIAERIDGHHAWVPSEVTGCSLLAEVIYNRLSMLSAGSGVAKCGHQELADNLDVGRNRVSDAIDELKVAGLVHQPKKGYYEVLLEAKRPKVR